MFPFAGSGDTARHAAPTLGDDWIKKVTDPVIAFKLHSAWACVIDVMIIHVAPVLPQRISGRLVSMRWHVTHHLWTKKNENQKSSYLLPIYPEWIGLDRIRLVRAGSSPCWSFVSGSAKADPSPKISYSSKLEVHLIN